MEDTFDYIDFVQNKRLQQNLQECDWSEKDAPEDVQARVKKMARVMVDPELGDLIKEAGTNTDYFVNVRVNNGKYFYGSLDDCKVMLKHVVERDPDLVDSAAIFRHATGDYVGYWDEDTNEVVIVDDNLNEESMFDLDPEGDAMNTVNAALQDAGWIYDGGDGDGCHIYKQGGVRIKVKVMAI